MKFDLVGEIIDHTLDDEFWRERSPYWRLDKIKCPVLSIGHWGKMGLHLRGNIVGYEEVKAPKKLVVTGARNTFEAHKMFDQVEFHEKECLPFYDLHLKGKNNGFMEAEPVRLFVRGANVWRAEEQWPPKAHNHVPYYLRKGPSGSVTSMNDGGLSADKPPAGEAGDQLHLSGLGVGQRRRDHRPGRPRRSGAARADLHHRAAGEGSRRHRADRAEAVRVIDRDRHPVHRQAHRPASAGRGGAQERASSRASRRCRRAGSRPRTARRTRSARSPTRPFYTHTNPQPLTPGEIYEFDIEVLPVSYVFKKGHRIRLELANGDSPATDGVFSHPYHPTQMGTDTIHHDAAHASCIMLPVIR